MGTESDPSEEEQHQIYSFHHFMILEFVAAKYVITLNDVSKAVQYFNSSSVTKNICFWTSCFYLNRPNGEI